MLALEIPITINLKPGREMLFQQTSENIVIHTNMNVPNPHRLADNAVSPL